MHILPIIFFLWALAVVFAYPLKHSIAADIQVLVFANVLEQLESAFYVQALKRFNATSFQAAGFASSQIPIQQIQTIASDENIHAITLESAIDTLGGQVVSNCTFNFSSALTDVNTMVAAARVVENVGISAYLGALSSLADPALVTAAGSIMAVEARHQSILNILSNATSIPQPFDVALTPADVLAIADTLISGCKSSFSANPPLTVTTSEPLQAGTKLKFSSPALNGTVSQLSCKIVTGGSNVPFYQPVNSCKVPANVTGPMYVFITKDQMAILSPSKTNGAASSSIVVAGPALLFINQQDSIGNLIRPNLNATDVATGNPTSAPTIPTATALSALPAIASNTTPPAPGTTSALSMSTYTSLTPMTAIPSVGIYTTTISPAQASALLSGSVS